MKNELKILNTTIKIGLEKPVKLLHITDTHITRDDPQGWNRNKTFDVDFDGCSEEYFFKALEYAKQNDLTVLHTGDMIDFFSQGNFDFVDKYLEEADYIYAPGNHDFCHLLGQDKGDYEYKWEKIKDIAPHIKNNLYFDSRIIGCVNVVTMDDSYYSISKGQLEMLRAEVAKGYPVILAMHVPIFTEELAEISYKRWNYDCAYLIGASDSFISKYSEERRLQQKPDSATLEAIEYIKDEPLIKAVVAGHTHLNFEGELRKGLMQYVTNGSFTGYVREITII